MRCFQRRGWRYIRHGHAGGRSTRFDLSSGESKRMASQKRANTKNEEKRSNNAEIKTSPIVEEPAAYSAANDSE